MSKYLKQAEQNVVNRAKAYNDFLEIIDALSRFGIKACSSQSKDKFFQGLQLMRDAIYTDQSMALRECFYFVGVGGKEAESYSKEMFKNAFGEDYSIMQFLEKWGNIPISYSALVEEEFRDECKQKIEELKNADENKPVQD